MIWWFFGDIIKQNYTPQSITPYLKWAGWRHPDLFPHKSFTVVAVYCWSFFFFCSRFCSVRSQFGWAIGSTSRVAELCVAEHRYCPPNNSIFVKMFPSYRMFSVVYLWRTNTFFADSRWLEAAVEGRNCWKNILQWTWDVVWGPISEELF